MIAPPKEQRILDVAFELFARHGFKKVTMSDLAEAADMSRPTLYAAFPNKEAVLEALGKAHCEKADAQTAADLPRLKTTEKKLRRLFEIWILEPFASIVDEPNGLDMLNIGVYAPAAHDDVYGRFQKQLLAILEPEMKGATMSAKDLAHIVTMATKGLKASSTSLKELERLTNGLIAMAIATGGL